MSNYQKLSRRDAEIVLRTATLDQLAQLACHPCKQVAKRAKFKLDRHAENVRLAQAEQNKRLGPQAQNLGRVMAIAQPPSVARAMADWGLTRGQVKAGLRAWGQHKSAAEGLTFRHDLASE